MIAVMLLSGTTGLAALESAGTGDTYQYDKMILELQGTGAPVVTGKYVIFTAKNGPRSVEIAFDFENYSTVHKFQIRKTRDIAGKVTDSLLYYVLEYPKNLRQISYRLIIDGLWTTDPINPEQYFDESNGILVSCVDINLITAPETEQKTDNLVHFIYQGACGQHIRLSGTFTNWDSWIYELEETEPGLYELSLPLQTGTYYYNYIVGMTALLDKSNPKRAYTKDGRIASVICVK